MSREQELAELHRSMVATQVEGLEFYAEKYRKLAGLTRAMGHDKLADVMDEVVRDTEASLEKTRALAAAGRN